MTTAVSASAEDTVLCCRCPRPYPPDQIRAVHGDDVTTLADLLDAKPAAPRQRLIGRRRQPVVVNGPDYDVVRLFKPFTFLCPMEHQVNGNRGTSVVISVTGANGSSKSHFLPGMIVELKTLQALQKVGVSLRDSLYGDGLGHTIHRVYGDHEVLPITTAGSVNGPYSYGITIRRPGDTSNLELSLELFDVSGEDLSSVVKIGENATFVLMSKAIFVLIDPKGIAPTQFDDVTKVLSLLDRERVAERARDGMGRLAEALSKLHKCPSQHLPVPIVVVVAKADAVAWKDFDWAAEHDTVLMSVTDDGVGLNDALAASSDRVRDAFAAVGGGSVINEVYDLFDPSKVRFVAASATSEMPSQAARAEGTTVAKWVEPQPRNEALAVLHALEMAGFLASPARSDA